MRELTQNCPADPSFTDVVWFGAVTRRPGTEVSELHDAVFALISEEATAPGLSVTLCGVPLREACLIWAPAALSAATPGNPPITQAELPVFVNVTTWSALLMPSSAPFLICALLVYAIASWLAVHATAALPDALEPAEPAEPADGELPDPAEEPEEPEEPDVPAALDAAPAPDVAEPPDGGCELDPLAQPASATTEVMAPIASSMPALR